MPPFNAIIPWIIFREEPGTASIILINVGYSMRPRRQSSSIEKARLSIIA